MSRLLEYGKRGDMRALDSGRKIGPQSTMSLLLYSVWRGENEGRKYTRTSGITHAPDETRSHPKSIYFGPVGESTLEKTSQSTTIHGWPEG